MSDAASDLSGKYDAAASGWADKMRLLGYFDAYLGFLTADGFRAPAGFRLLDIGCGTGAAAEAWVAVQGADSDVTLLDPSAEMLVRASGALSRRNARSSVTQDLLETHRPDRPYDGLLAAHVIEHAADPLDWLRSARTLVREGGQLWIVVSKPHWCNAIIWVQWRHRAYRAQQMRDLFQASGWTLEREYAFPAGPPSRTSRGYVARAGSLSGPA